MAGLPGMAALIGEWRMDRVIRNADGSEQTFRGTARFHRAGRHVIQDEDGLLDLGAGEPPLRATRRYIWRQEGGRLECSFEDGRPFHTVPLGAERPETVYLCPPDRYAVSYDFGAKDRWSSTWRVEGPKKDYAMTTLYRRGAETPA